MNKPTGYDFEGWCTKANLRCSDGRVIMPHAFAHCNGATVPLVWNHQHGEISNVLGHAILEDREDGVWAYGYLNNTQQGNDAREDILHGDINAMSIYANKLQQDGANVKHGTIKEVSLVLAGANPGATIVSSITHGDDADDAAMIWMGEDIDSNLIQVPGGLQLYHADDDDEDGEEKSMANKEKTVQDVLDTLNEEQMAVVEALIGEALQKGSGEVKHSDDDPEDLDGDEEEEEGAEEGKENPDDEEHGDDKGNEDDYEEGESMKHNVFDGESSKEGLVLTHSDQANIIKGMKQYGTFNESLKAYAESAGVHDAALMHADSDYGIERSVTAKTYGVDHETLQDQNYFVNDPSFLFPDARELNNVPKFIQRKMDWVAGVISGTKHSPFSRVKTRFADITEDEARAKGYIKGKMKKEEVFTLLKRTTTPTTIYKKQKMDRDDLVDITDFDVVAWIKNEMRMMLNEELARAILFGDGRSTSLDDKINEQNIRPIWTDHELFTINKKVEFAANATEDDEAKAIIKAAVKARKDYRGAGNPTCYMTEDMLTNMLLLEDSQGYRLYKSEAEVASAMRVSRIVTVPVMENLTRTVAVAGGGSETRTLQAIIVNLSDYQVGTDRGGEINSFEQFDIDYNQQKFLIETRCSGALITPYSAIVIESTVAGG